MSETVYYTGKIKPVEIIDNVESTARIILLKSGLEIKSDIYDSYVEQLEDMLYDQYLVTDEDIFEVISQSKNDPDDDMFEASRNADGTINFTVKYYNGGCSFGEAIEEALQNLK